MTRSRIPHVVVSSDLDDHETLAAWRKRQEAARRQAKQARQSHRIRRTFKR